MSRVIAQMNKELVQFARDRLALALALVLPLLQLLMMGSSLSLLVRDLPLVAERRPRLDELLESLDLRGATVVPQDWGGPIGLYWTTRHPERVDGLFILNTYAHGFRREALPPGKDEIPLPLPLRLFRMRGIGELLVKGLDAFKRGFLFGQGTVHRERLTPTVKRAYRAVHQGWSERTPILVFPREIPVTGEGPVVAMTTEIEERLKEHFRSKPVRIMWAMKDIAFLPIYLDTLWLRTFPGASVTKLDDAGHYLQEDAHERIVPELVSWSWAKSERRGLARPRRFDHGRCRSVRRRRS